MKKLITLLLAVAGMVGTVSATTIYVQNNCSWADLMIHRMNGSNKTEWPGVKINTESAVTVVVDGVTYYEVDFGDCKSFLFDDNDKGHQTEDLSDANITDGHYYSFLYKTATHSPEYYELHQDATATYTYNFTVTTSESWSGCKMTLWNSSNSSAITGFSFPGKEITGTDNVYTYTHKSFISKLGVLFVNPIDGNPQTCDMTAEPGSNYYKIYGVATGSNQGNAVKTNDYGYATAVSKGHIVMPTGIAYVAEDKGDWAKAYTVRCVPYDNGFLVKGDANTYYNFTYGTEVALPCVNAFKKGSGSGVESGTGPYNYILNGNMFKAANGQNVASTKAYLQLTSQVPAGARALIFNDDEDVAGITSAALSQAKEQVYDLQGRSVAQPTKGFYIVNGKKVIMK